MPTAPSISSPPPGNLNPACIGSLGEEAGQCPDTVYEILIRLPVKTLCRFKCACKSWYSLISHPSFQKDHHRLTSQRSPNLLVVSRTDHDDNNVPVRLHLSTYTSDLINVSSFCKTVSMSSEGYGRERLSIYPAGSCLGLVCLVSWLGTSILVCNPSTTEMIPVPQPLNMRYHAHVGFGHGISTKRPKVIRFFNCEWSAKGENFCEIFTLGSCDGWRKATSPPFFLRRGAPLLHGALHLLPFEESVEGYAHYIAAFDMDTEEYRKILLPEIYFEEAMYKHGLVVISGSLCLGFENDNVVQLWFLKDYGSGKWVKEHTIDFSSEAFNYYWHYPIAIMGDGSILLNVAGDEDGYTLRLFSTRENRFTKKIKNDYSGIFYVESLFALGTEMPGGSRQNQSFGHRN